MYSRFLRRISSVTVTVIGVVRRVRVVPRLPLRGQPRSSHRGKRVLALADHTTITIVHLDTGEIIATNTINPDKTYWRDTQKEPADGRALSPDISYVATQMTPMSRLITRGE